MNDNSLKNGYYFVVRIIKLRIHLVAHLAQRLVHLIRNQKVASSNLVVGFFKKSNWQIFLKYLQKLRIKNNEGEYFLRVKFYTYINNRNLK